MKAYRDIDIEEEVRAALAEKFTAFASELPAKYKLPNIVVKRIGGTPDMKIGTYNVTLDARAKDSATADETMRTALAYLEAIAWRQTTKIRHIEINSSGSWGNDPLRPDLAMCTAMLLVTAHRETVDL